MALDELLGRTDIKFPRPISMNEIRKLFSRLAVTLDCVINYTFKTSHQVAKIKDKEYVSDRLLSIQVFGTVRNRNKFTSSSFSGDKNNMSGYSSMIEGISFQTIPGYDSLEEYEEEEIKIWDNVREGVREYFSQRDN